MAPPVHQLRSGLRHTGRDPPGTIESLIASAALTVLGVVFVGVLVGADDAARRVRLFAKPAASICFVTTAVVNGALDSAYGSWVVVALVLSAIGDVALLGRSSRMFLFGLGSFLFGHVGYVLAFGVRGLDVMWAAVAFVALVPPVVFVLVWLLPHAGSLRIPVVAYTAVISTMVAAAVGTVGVDLDLRILAGAVAFYLSDLAVARDRFVAPGRVNRTWGLPLYYAAQFLLAWTVV